MEVTFLIGNGFDLNLGLCTKYTDFYPHYIDDSRFDSDDPAVRSFKQLLRRGGDYDRWADFEAALGAHTTEPPLNEADSSADACSISSAALPSTCGKKTGTLISRPAVRK